MIGLSCIAVGVSLVVAGSIYLFGAVAAVVAGLTLIAAGVLVDWEALHDEHPAPPSL